jgi:hypothetical protein
MKKLSIIFLFTCITALTVGCRVAFIVAEGGEVQYEDIAEVLHTCEAANTCIVDLEWRGKVSDDEFFTAIPDSGWYFHKWEAGKRFLCGDSALPVCHLDFEWIEDHPDFPEIFASSGLFYLMPVFKDYPRVLLEDEPRTITADGKKQLWLQPADFSDYSYDQVSAICPEGICSGTLPGSTTDLTGYFWASREEVSLLFLAYHQAGEHVTDDFEITRHWPAPSVRGILHGQPFLPGEIFNCAIAVADSPVDHYYNGEDGHRNRSCKVDADSERGFWFWRAND